MGTAITLVATMGGMAVGSLAMGKWLDGRVVERPLRLYGWLEGIIGLAGAVLLQIGFEGLASLDSTIYATAPGVAHAAHLAGIVVILGPATLAMGATIPVLGLIGRSEGCSLAILYGTNTAGAAIGVIFSTFILLPALGLELTGIALGFVNLMVAALTQFLAPPDASTAEPESSEAPAPAASTPKSSAWILAAVSGFVILGLEVTWFRALKSVFHSRNESFAIMLVAVLIPLALGARLAHSIRSDASAGPSMALGGGLVLLATPVLERFDIYFASFVSSPWTTYAAWLGATLVTLGPGTTLIAVALPRLLQTHEGTLNWGRLYAVNTAASVIGSLAAAWLILPAIGPEQTAWALAGLAAFTGVAVTPARQRRVAGALCSACLVVAIVGASGAGHTRVQGAFSYPLVRTIAIEHGPDATYAVADDESGDRLLIIDGFSATSRESRLIIWRGWGDFPCCYIRIPRMPSSFVLEPAKRRMAFGKKGRVPSTSSMSVVRYSTWPIISSRTRVCWMTPE